MKVVLKKAVLKLGIPGDIVNVKPGFAFNFLIPSQIALHANQENLKEIEAKKSEILKEHEEVKTLAAKIKEVIEGKYVFMEKPVNDAGNLYATINPSEVAAILNTQFSDLNFEFNKNQILISNKIRNYGIFDFTATLYNGVIAKLKLVIALTKSAGEEMASASLAEK